MRVVVTGAAGFLGRHVARRFRDDGWHVVGFDIQEFSEPGIETFIGDLCDLSAAAAVTAGVDAIAHVGAIGDVYLAASDPSLAARVNVVGTSNLIDAAITNHARLVYASTWEVYGEPQYEPIDERHPTMPDHPYSITKLAGESLILAATRLSGLDAVSLRLGTAYGSRLRPNSVFRIFLDKARRGDPILIQGDGNQGRQFTHASDIARAFASAAASSETGIPINIVAPETISIKELADAIITQFPTEVAFGPARPGDVPAAKVSAELAREVIGWSAEVSFEEGLEEFIADAVESR